MCVGGGAARRSKVEELREQYRETMRAIYVDDPPPRHCTDGPY